MKFFIPTPKDRYRLKEAIDVNCPFSFVNKNADLYMHFYQVTYDVVRSRFLRADSEFFSIPLTEGLVFEIGQIYVRKGGWHENSVVVRKHGHDQLVSINNDIIRM